ncbi:MAG: hypothetical protein H7839_09400 [Magnetococcus sp. YQC-5]
MTSTRQDSSLQSVISKYALLTKTEQAVLQFLSIFVLSTNRTNLAKYLLDAGVLGDNGKALTIAELTPITDRLTRLDLIIIAKHDNNYFQCASAVANYATQAALIEGRFRKMANVVLAALASYLFSAQYHNNTSVDICKARLRVAVFSRNPTEVVAELQSCREIFLYYSIMERPLVTICATPFDVEWFRGLPPPIQAEAMDEIVSDYLENFTSVEEIVPLLRAFRHHLDTEYIRRFRKLLVTILIFQGHIVEAQAILNAADPVENGLALQGWIHFLRGENESAIQHFEALLKSARKIIEKRQIILGEISGTFYLLALLKSSDPLHRTRLGEQLELVNKKPKMTVTPLADCFKAILLAQGNKVDNAVSLLDPYTRQVHYLIATITGSTHESADADSCLIKLFKSVARFWIDIEYARKKNTGLKDLFNQAKQNGHQWAAMEIASLLAALGQDAASYGEYAAKIQQETGMQSILPIISQEEGWERALRAMIQLGVGRGGKVEAKTGSNSRMIWLIGMSGNVVTNIQPREQVRSASGSWTKGRPIALKRLF